MIVDIVLTSNSEDGVRAIVASRAVKQNGVVEVRMGLIGENLSEFRLEGSGIKQISAKADRILFEVTKQPTDVVASYKGKELPTPVIDMDAKDGLENTVLALTPLSSARGGYILASQFYEDIGEEKTTEWYFHLESASELLEGNAHVLVDFEGVEGHSTQAPEGIRLDRDSSDKKVTFGRGKYKILACYVPHENSGVEFLEAILPLHAQVGGGEEGDVDIIPWP